MYRHEKKPFGFWYNTAHDLSRWTRVDVWRRLRKGQSPWKDCFDSPKYYTDLSSHWRSKTVHESKDTGVDQAHESGSLCLYYTQWPLLLGDQIANGNWEQHLGNCQMLISKWCPFPFRHEFASCHENILAVSQRHLRSLSCIVSWPMYLNTNCIQNHSKWLNMHLILGTSCNF